MDKPSENESDAEFQRVLGNLANTPHKPHVKTEATKSVTKTKGRRPGSTPKTPPPVT